MRRVLIANRGEIAVRVARACHAAGLETVAIFSEADETALHARVATRSVCVGPAPATESYLNVDAILEAAARTGADAVHPGYGFLSENAGFAERVKAAGLTWIGPDPAAIRAMGSKIQARERMIAAGVPVVPGEHAAHDDDALHEAAARVGFPVLIKASAGGGGKGMRICEDPADLADLVASARREAKAAFADDAVYIEKLLLEPRHIEIQILGDQHGNVVHLMERECSIQRRHQKVLEECPSPVLDEALRARMGAAAVAAAKAVDYVGAGTVEFMLDQRMGFYFLEMNTRLQVEHPVTEMVLGLDLVDLQLRVAQGEPLPLTQEDVIARGHAIEVRLYAEDPARGFLPASGPLLRYRPPAGPGIRHDGGFVEGDEIGTWYDPMLAKLIAWGTDRRHALGRLREALDDFEIHGLTTNLSFLRALVRDEVLASGDTHTGFIAERFGEALAHRPEPDEDALIAAALYDALGLGKTQTAAPSGASDADTASPWHALGAFRGVS